MTGYPTIKRMFINIIKGLIASWNASKKMTINSLVREARVLLEGRVGPSHVPSTTTMKNWAKEVVIV